MIDTEPVKLEIKKRSKTKERLFKLCWAFLILALFLGLIYFLLLFLLGKQSFTIDEKAKIIKNKNEFSLLSYNILGGTYTDKILDELKKTVEKPDIACFQEFPENETLSSRFEQYFGDNYSSEKSLSVIMPKRKMGVATFYNSRKFKLQGSKILHLPTPKWTIWERMYTWSLSDDIPEPYDRTALITILEYDNTTLLIANTHSAWEGGKKQQMKQLEYILKEIKKLDIDRIILCGDFNFNIINNKASQPLLEKLRLEGFEDVTSNVPYSADLASPFSFPEDKAKVFKYTLKLIGVFLDKIGINTKRKVDYIFTKGIKNTFDEIYEIKGSDHYPIVVYLVL